MRSTAAWVLRHLIVPVGLIWATGIFSVFTFDAKSSKDALGSYNRFDSSEFAELEMTPATLVAYGDSLYKARESQIAQTGRYKPFDYFHDLRQYKLFEARYMDSLNTTTMGRVLYMRCLSCAGSRFSSFVDLRDGNWCKGNNRAGNDEARNYWFPKEAAREVESAKHPIKWKDDVCKPVLGWLMRLYLKGLPVALLMLLMWKQKNREERRAFALLPTSLLLSLLLWPIVLFIDIRNRMHSLLQYTEVMTRRETMLSLLSKEEQSLLAFGKRMSRKEFKAYLDGIGRVRRHSFALALACSLLLALLVPGRSALASSYAIPKERHAAISCQVNKRAIASSISSAHSPPGMSREALAPQALEKVFERKAKEIFHFPLTIGRVLAGFVLEQRGVPKGLIAFS